jgi:hypothetical protein
MFARHRDTGRVDHINLNPARLQPARKPEAVAASLECYDNAVDYAAGLGGFVLPASITLAHRDPASSAAGA